MSRFFDTNILVYAYSLDPKKSCAVALLRQVPDLGGHISVQVLNELANVLWRKIKLDWPEIERSLSNTNKIFGSASPLTQDTHETAIALCQSHQLSFYDALIVASALEAGCTQLVTEDMQHGRRFGDLMVFNPFL